MKENILDEKAVNFALEIIRLSKDLDQSKDFVISNQLLKSGTSIGANIRESQSAESKKDFVHKLSISLKEARETRYWLELLIKSKIIDNQKHKKLDSYCTELIKILSRIIITTKRKYLRQI